nr:hypothetical protein [Tanacetum cinerariifolium]
MPQGIRPPIIINNIPYKQYTITLFSSSSSEFSPTPPPKIVDKGKRIATEEDQTKQLMPTSGEGQITIKEAKAQMEDIKRLKFLKVEKEKSEKKLKVLTREQLRAQAEELAAYEAKREKMLEEYNHCINFRAGPLPITKISYRVYNSTKE